MILLSGLFIASATDSAAQLPGDLDSSFAGVGVAFLSGVGEVRDVIQLQDERLLAVVATSSNSGTMQVLAPNGVLDDQFGQNGSVVLPLAPVRVFEQSDGRIVVVGNDEFGRVARYHADGAMDQEYTENGSTAWVFASVGHAALYRDADMDADGRLYIAADHLERGVFLRLGNDALLDTTFASPHGYQAYQVPYGGVPVMCRGVRIGPDGKVYFLRKTYSPALAPSGPLIRLEVIRCLLDGTLDSIVHSKYFVPPYMDQIPSALNISAFGRVSYLTYTTHYGYSRVVRVGLVDGQSLDTYPPPHWEGRIHGNVGLEDATGRLIVPYGGVRWTQPIGYGSDHLGFGVFRSMPDTMRADHSWGGNGVVEVFTDSVEGSAALSAMFQANGKLVVGGWVRSNGEQLPVLVRYHYLPDFRAKLDLRLLLGGAFEASLGSMRDDLRSSGSLPLEHPFDPLEYVPTGTTQEFGSSAAVMELVGDRAPVDWVWIESLDANDPSIVISTRVGLLRRDGHVTAPDSEGPIDFDTGAGSYFIRVRHRNHLSVTLAEPVALGVEPTTVDLSDPATPTFGTEAQKELNGVMMLWPGDANANGRVSYVGAGNDRDRVLVAVGGANPTAVLSGYHPEDVNLDGVVKYTGSHNDRDIILQSVGGVTPHAVRWAQEP